MFAFSPDVDKDHAGRIELHTRGNFRDFVSTNVAVLHIHCKNLTLLPWSGTVRPGDGLIGAYWNSLFSKLKKAGTVIMTGAPTKRCECGCTNTESMSGKPDYCSNNDPYPTSAFFV